MDEPNKLPLLQSAFALLADRLRPQDRVTVLTYSSEVCLALPSTSGDRKDEILTTIERLQAGGGTAGGPALQLAYDIAREHHVAGGNNRIILATDGNFHYVNGLLEARKVLIEEMGGTILTLAKDVKLQVEFNPARVAGYRLIGYENRLLADEDFNDDTRDAGELGAGHTVTTLYEVVPVGTEVPRAVDALRYQPQPDDPPLSEFEDEMLYVKVRYKDPDGSKSRLLEQAVADRTGMPSTDFRFATAVAGFGMLLRDSPHAGTLTLDDIVSLAEEGKGHDPRGYRGEFIRLVEVTRDLGLLKAADPVPHAARSPVGQAWLFRNLGLPVPHPAVESYVVAGARRTEPDGSRTVELYPMRYAPNDSVIAHLRFALRHEAFDLGVLVAALRSSGSVFHHSTVSRAVSPIGRKVRPACTAAATETWFMPIVSPSGGTQLVMWPQGRISCSAMNSADTQVKVAAEPSAARISSSMAPNCCTSLVAL